MPHTYTKEELEMRYKKLPEPLKEAMFSPEVAEKMFEIGKKHGLTIEKTGFMAEESGFIILGLTRPREFIKILSDRLDIDRDAASAIASDINHQVLFPLREALKNAHNIEVSEAELQKEDMIPPRPAPSLTPTPAPAATPAKPAPMMPQATPAQWHEQELITTKPPVPGIISPEHVARIVTEEKEKIRMSDPPPPPPPQEKPTPPRTPPAPGPIDLSKIPQIIPKESPAIPQRIPELKNTIDLRKQPGQKLEVLSANQVSDNSMLKLPAEIPTTQPSPAPAASPQKSVQESAPISQPAPIILQQKPVPESVPMPLTPPQPPPQPIPMPVPQQVPAPSAPPPAPQAREAPAPQPIVIPQKPKLEPLQNIPQNPKIPPIDLRTIPPKPIPAAPSPQPKTYESYDPYREPVE